jgi:hypothetical protein
MRCTKQDRVQPWTALSQQQSSNLLNIRPQSHGKQEIKDVIICTWSLQICIMSCKIFGFHGGDYEEWRLLGCYAMWLL